jgi:hypothetical protein
MYFVAYNTAKSVYIGKKRRGGSKLPPTGRGKRVAPRGIEGDVGVDVVPDIVMTVAINTDVSTIPLRALVYIRNT